MLLFIVFLSAASASAPRAQDIPAAEPAKVRKQCPETPMSLARKLGKRAPRAVPLNELPPAQTFMAVDRRVDGCPAPLTMVQYRSAGQR
jgi:hypothetical protein